MDKNVKRVLLMLVYMALFIFSLYSIFRVRYFIYEHDPSYYEKITKVLFFNNMRVSYGTFLFMELTLFALMAIVSFILMLSNFYIYEHPPFHKRVLKHTNEDVKKILKK